MKNQITFKQLENNWYQGELTIGQQKAVIRGHCEKNPTDHLHAAYRFFINGGFRAQCVFNQDTWSYLLIMRRDSDKLHLDVIQLGERFENNAKLKSMQYLENNVTFSATMPLENLPDALFTQTH